MSTRNQKLTKNEIRDAFAQEGAAQTPVILSPARLAALLGLSTKTIYEWISKGRLDGAFRKRGKHVLLWRDRALDIIYNGKEWSHA